MPLRCKVCKGYFDNSPDSLVLCNHHQGNVHLGCCINSCSWNKQPCQNAKAVFDKI